MIVSKRLEKNRTSIGCPVFFDRQRATFHVVFMFSLRSETFKRLGRVVTRVEKGIRDEVMIRRLDNGVINVARQIVKVRVAPVVGSIPVAVIVKLRDVVEHRGLRLLIDYRRIVFGETTVIGILGGSSGYAEEKYRQNRKAFPQVVTSELPRNFTVRFAF